MIGEYEAQELIDEMIIRTVDTEVVNKGQNVEKAISFYANCGYSKNKQTEVVAECFASKNSKDLSQIIIDEIERMMGHDSTRDTGAKSNY